MLIHVCSVQFSLSVVSDSLWPRGLRHARLPRPWPTPGARQSHVHWLGDAIQPSHPPSFPSPALNLSQYQGLFKWVSSPHQVAQLQHQLLQCHWLGHRLGLLWYWMVCLGNKKRSFCYFWDCIQILHSFLEHNGYSISSKGVLPTVVDIMVIWVKFSHSSPF